MIGAILAGGYGKRLKPHTDKVPKGLLELKPGYTILHKQLDDFFSAGIKRVVLLTGYLSDKIEETFGNEYHGISIEYQREEKPLGKLFSMRNLISVCHDDVVVRNGDTVCDIDIGKMARSARESECLISVFVTRMRSPFGVVDLDSDRITGFREKPVLDVFINAGIYYIKKESFPLFLEEYDSTEVETSVFPTLAGRRLMLAYLEEGEWIGIDSEKELEAARNEFQQREEFEWGYRKLISGVDRKWKYRINSGKAIEVPFESALNVLQGRLIAYDRTLEAGMHFNARKGAILKAADVTAFYLSEK
ncbi:MAG: nucleotidyltransferase family protein [Candidatus Thermoplasmatota archaeon]|nr:nucleotidyltransferase family protein [Candidatus Thermoplasmatota archaeon]